MSINVLSARRRSVGLARIGAVCAVVAPAVLLVGALLVPAGDQVATEYFDGLAASPARAGAATVVSFAGFVLLVPGVVALLAAAAPRAGALGTAAAVLVVPGAAAFPALVSTNSYDTRLAALPDRALALQLYEDAAASAAALVPLLVGVVGLSLGLVLLGAALVRARLAPRWVPVALLAGLVLLTATSSPLLAALGYLPVLAALARSAAPVLRSGP